MLLSLVLQAVVGSMRFVAISISHNQLDSTFAFDVFFAVEHMPLIVVVSHSLTHPLTRSLTIS